MFTLEAVLVQVTSGNNSHPECRSSRSGQNHTGLRLQVSPSVHEHVNRSAQLLLPVEVKRSTDQQVAPAERHTDTLLVILSSLQLQPHY